MDEYHDLYVTRDTLLLIDVSENFKKMCLVFYELGSAKSFSAPGSA